MQHQAACAGKVVNHLEGITLIENVLGRAVIGREAVFSTRFRRYRIEINVERQRSEVAVDVYAVVLEDALFVQVARRGVSGPGGIVIHLEFLDGLDGTGDRVEHAGKQPDDSTPDGCRTHHDDANKTVQGTPDAAVPISVQTPRGKAHCLYLSATVGRIRDATTHDDDRP